jgi:hypothetical protein
VNADLTLTIITPPTVPPSIDEAKAKNDKPFSVAEFMNAQEPVNNTVTGQFSKQDKNMRDFNLLKDALGGQGNANKANQEQSEIYQNYN